MARKPRISEVALSDIQFDPNNANIGTERGLGALKASIAQFGFVEAGVLDKDNMLIGGNKRTDAAAQLDMSDALIIDHDGKSPIYIRVADYDLDSDDPAIRERSTQLAIALNRIAQLSLQWDPDKITALDSGGLDLSAFFDKDELSVFVHAAQQPPTLDQLESEFGDTPDERSFWPVFSVKMPPDTLQRFRDALALYEGETHEQLDQLLDALDLSGDARDFDEVDSTDSEML